MKQAHRFSGPGQPYEGLTRLGANGPIWTGKIRLVPEKLAEPLSWRKPRLVFVNSMSDLFHEDVPDEFIDRVFAVMAVARKHTYQVLTKRPARMAAYFADRTLGDVFTEALRSEADEGVHAPTAPDLEHVRLSLKVADQWDRAGLDHPRPLPTAWPLPNVYLGTSVEDSARLPRIDHLRRVPAAVRFLSLEPLLEDLGPLDLTGIDWVIVGGESGPGARPCRLEWLLSLKDQCRAAGVPYFCKQLGSAPMLAYYEDRSIPDGTALREWALDRRRGDLRIPKGVDLNHSTWNPVLDGQPPPNALISIRTDDRKGGAWDDWPDSLRVREMPRAPLEAIA